MTSSPVIETKGEFARRINVTPGRISQMIKANQITGDALVGKGRSAKIKIDQALNDLNLNLDAGQMSGNGLKTDLTPHSDSSGELDFGAKENPDPVPSRNQYAVQLQAEKVEQAKIRTRQLLAEEAAKSGRYMLTADVEAAMTKQIGNVLLAFESVVPQLAANIADEFQLSQRDVMHVVKTQFENARAILFERQERRKAETPQYVSDDIAIE